MPVNYELFRTSVVSINFKTHEANDINDVIDNNKQLLRQCCISFKAVLRGFKTWNIYSSWDRRFRMKNWRSMPLDKRGNKGNTPRPMSWGWWWSDRTRGMAKHTYGVLIMMTRRDDVVRVKVGFNADNPHASPSSQWSRGDWKSRTFLFSRVSRHTVDGGRAALPALHQSHQGGWVRQEDRLFLPFYESIADLLATLLDICNLGYGTFAHIWHLPNPVNPILSSTFMGYLSIV